MLQIYASLYHVLLDINRIQMYTITMKTTKDTRKAVLIDEHIHALLLHYTSVKCLKMAKFVERLIKKAIDKGDK